MDFNTFGDSDRFKMLVGLTDLVFKQKDSRRAYLSSFIGDFNAVCLQIAVIDNIRFRKYVIRLTREDYERRVEEMKPKFELPLVTHLDNFIKAKLKSL